MITDQALEVLIKTNFSRVLRMFNYALQHGLTTRDELLSDYQWGIAKNLKKAKRGVRGTTIEQFLHYHGVCEAQSQFRLKKQRSVISECSSGHTYAFNKSRTTCPKCNNPFIQVQKFQPIEDEHQAAAPAISTFDIASLQMAVSAIDAPWRQKQVLKALVSDRILLEEQHMLSATAKVTGLSRQRVNIIVKQNREALRRALAAASVD